MVGCDLKQSVFWQSEEWAGLTDGIQDTFEG